MADGRADQRSLLPADFPAWNLTALTGTDADDAEELLEQLVDAVLVDVAGVDATGLIRYRLHDLLRACARECLAEAEPPDVREESLGPAGRPVHPHGWPRRWSSSQPHFTTLPYPWVRDDGTSAVPGGAGPAGGVRGAV
jgi:hypothetical protein